ncbi:hypothetical protein NEOKW01_0652 [Nematocida sp. AWRm80]|nr:hypothetical protein NEOKW01_0652 [Nematocida sp. AWRm80]
MALKEKKKEKKSPLEGIEIDSIDIEGLTNIDTDNIPLIDYTLKENKIFGELNDLSNDSLDELDITKIYNNELEDEIDSCSNSNIYRLDTLDNKYKESIPVESYKLELNSDVGNDICLDNINKIYTYLKNDLELEKQLEEEIQKSIAYLQNRTA